MLLTSPILRTLAVAALLALAAVGVILAKESAPGSAGLLQPALIRGGFGEAGLGRLEQTMAPGADALARRLDPKPHADFWNRPRAWTTLDLAQPPSLPFGLIPPDDAMRLNALLPASLEPQTPAQPFILNAAGPERERAVLCMTQAIYYEAALEPLDGQRAVAQTVLNRLRHPDFPKSVCGVIYQGSSQITGCQFSFTCDGSRERAPVEPYWGRSRAVAEEALSGFVQKEIGPATHYHADYVFPRWGPTMVKIGQIGAHIFYRYPGPLGRAEELNGHYAGGELQVSMAGPSPEAIAAAKAAAAAGQVPVESVLADAPTSPSDLRPRVAGQIVFGRRIPSKDEIAKINAQLAGLDGDKAPALQPSAIPAIAPPPPTH
ncbi:MAG: cell wall hydrolase [Caulobacterales bacterium]